MITHTQGTPSALLAMHRRYEANSTECTAIDATLSEARRSDAPHKYRLEHGLTASITEADALRLTMLYQVPSDMAEAAILQFHIANTVDLVTGCEERRDHEETALKVATQTLFDFLACEMKGDHFEAAGPAFRDEAVRAYFARRYRTGEIGE